MGGSILYSTTLFHGQETAAHFVKPLTSAWSPGVWRLQPGLPRHSEQRSLLGDLEPGNGGCGGFPRNRGTPASSYFCLVVGNEGMIHNNIMAINNDPMPPFPSMPYVKRTSKWLISSKNPLNFGWFGGTTLGKQPCVPRPRSSRYVEAVIYLLRVGTLTYFTSPWRFQVDPWKSLVASPLLFSFAFIISLP